MSNQKVAVITGATAGIGLAAAIECAKKGLAIIGIGRSIERCSTAKQTILQACPDANVTYLLCDLSSQAAIRSLAADIRARANAIDVLINNAGTVSSWFMTTEDGIELQFAVNHLAGFLLTNELLPCLKNAPQGRVVTVSSGSHYGAKLDFSDLQMRKRYNCLQAYKRVKLCNVLFTVELNRRLGANSSVRAFAADPGLVKTQIGLKGTGGMVKWFWKMRMSGGVEPCVPGRALAFLATDPKAFDNRAPYWYNGKPKNPNRYALDENAGTMLWEASQRLCMIK